MVKPYRCPSCRAQFFDETTPNAYKCFWCGDTFTEQDVIEDGGYHPFEKNTVGCSESELISTMAGSSDIPVSKYVPMVQASGSIIFLENLSTLSQCDENADSSDIIESGNRPSEAEVIDVPELPEIPFDRDVFEAQCRLQTNIALYRIFIGSDSDAKILWMPRHRLE